jgi:ribosome-associated protein|tara:strand:+ start:57 stop:395 length:339 start_codon:yes stop_codon:yes gene_type:complete
MVTIKFREVEISKEPIELYKVLKFESLVTSGGEAKAAVASGLVLVNGEREVQKRKKMVSGDTIEFGAEKIVLKLSSTAINATELRINKTKIAAKKASTKRKPISVSSTGRNK